MPDCGAATTEAKDPKTSDTSADSKALNRCLPVTDKGKSTWQRRTIRCKGGAFKSVCRELPRVALAAYVGAHVSSAYESLRAGVPNLATFEVHSDTNQ
jgi:hypothetical protein